MKVKVYMRDADSSGQRSYLGAYRDSDLQPLIDLMEQWSIQGEVNIVGQFFADGPRAGFEIVYGSDV